MFDIRATDLSYIIILIVQPNYFFDLYPAKILGLLAKLFFFYIRNIFNFLREFFQCFSIKSKLP